MQVYIESLMRFGSTTTKPLMFLNQSLSICGWTTLSLTTAYRDVVVGLSTFTR